MTNEPSVKNEPIKILSFDPGQGNMGWAISEYTIENGDFHVLNYGVFKASKVAKKRKEEVLDFGQRLVSLSVICEEVEKLLLSHQPHYVVTEDTFFNPGTPQAYVSLLLCIHTVERTLYRTFFNGKLKHQTAKKLYKIAPSTIKMIISGKGSNFKQQVIDSIIENEQITFKNSQVDENGNPLITLIEHEADAIAGGFTFAKTNLIIL